MSEPRKRVGGQHIDDIGLSFSTFRVHDPSLARWLQVDPLAESMPWNSPFVAMNNDPIYYADPHGDIPVNLAAAAGGAVVGGVINLGMQLWNGNIDSWGDAGVAFGIGAVAGAVTGFTMGASAGVYGTATLGASIASGVVSGIASGAVGGLIQETGNALYFQDMSFGDAVSGPGLTGAIWGGAIGGVFGGVSGYFSYSPTVSTGPANQAVNAADEVVTIQVNGKTIDVPGIMHQFPDVIDGAGNVVHQGGKYIDNFIPKAGTFSISNWSGYPLGIPKPKGPFRLLSGSEYEAARKAANRANAAMRRADPDLYKGMEIHEIHPVKYGGSATDPANKMILTKGHHRKVVTPWWNKLMRNIQN